MNAQPLKREALSHVLESLLRSELALTRRGVSTQAGLGSTRGALWTDDLHLGDDGEGSLGCDSLDRMRLAAATNEMFHLNEVDQELDLLSDPTFGAWLNAIEIAWRRGVSRITFTTSGSTGTPKRCTHEFTDLQTEVNFLGEVFAGRTRVVLFAPLHHIYGFLLGAMLPNTLGAETVLATMPEGARFNSLLQAGDLVVSFPEQWQWFERTVGHWPEDVQGVVSTAPCPPELLAALHERGLQKMTELYGSSETGGIGLRFWPEAKYRFMPHWQTVSAREEGSMELINTSGRRVCLMDRLRIDVEGTFTLEGRTDGAVQVGGTNVHPFRIAALLRTHPDVSDAVVRLMRPEQGSRLKAFIVACYGVDCDVLRLELETRCSQSLRSFERPTALTFGTCLPKNYMGKECDW
jgi:long-chain acyl-CoA synthetase